MREGSRLILQFPYGYMYRSAKMELCLADCSQSHMGVSDVSMQRT